MERAENSSTSPLFVGESGAKGSLDGLEATGSQGSLPVAGGVTDLLGAPPLSTAQGSLPHIPKGTS